MSFCVQAKLERHLNACIQTSRFKRGIPLSRHKNPNEAEESIDSAERTLTVSHLNVAKLSSEYAACWSWCGSKYNTFVS